MAPRPPENINEISPLDVLVGSRLSVNSTLSSNRGSSCILDAFPFSPDMPASPAHTTDYSSCSSPSRSPQRSPVRSSPASPSSPVRSTRSARSSPVRSSPVRSSPVRSGRSSPGRSSPVRNQPGRIAQPRSPHSPRSPHASSPHHNAPWIARSPLHHKAYADSGYMDLAVPTLTATASTVSSGFARRWSSSSTSTTQSQPRGSVPDIYSRVTIEPNDEDDGFDWGLTRELKNKPSHRRLVDKLEEDDRARPPIRRGHTFSQSWDATALQGQRPLQYVSPEFARQGRSRPNSPTIYPTVDTNVVDPYRPDDYRTDTYRLDAVDTTVAPKSPGLKSPDELTSPVPSFDFETSPRPRQDLRTLRSPESRGHANSHSWDARSPRMHPPGTSLPGTSLPGNSLPVVATLPPHEHLRAGITAYVNGSVPIAFQHWSRAAAAGEPVSRLLVDIAVHEGWAKAAQPPDIACIYELSASDLQNAIPAEMAAPVADGLVNMGLSRIHGAADERFALRSFELAAALGSRDASTAAASMYMKGGKHLQRNAARARQLFHQFP